MRKWFAIKKKTQKLEKLNNLNIHKHLSFQAPFAWPPFMYCKSARCCIIPEPILKESAFAVDFMEIGIFLWQDNFSLNYRIGFFLHAFKHHYIVFWWEMDTHALLNVLKRKRMVVLFKESYQPSAIGLCFSISSWKYLEVNSQNAQASDKHLQQSPL